MSDLAATASSARENSAVLRLTAGPLLGPVLARVVAMMLARADCPVDRLDDAMLICDALSAYAPGLAEDERVRLTILTDGSGMTLRVGSLQAGGAERLMKESVLPGVGSILETITDEMRIERSDQDGGELVLRLHFTAASVGEQPAGSPQSG